MVIQQPYTNTRGHEQTRINTTHCSSSYPIDCLFPKVRGDRILSAETHNVLCTNTPKPLDEMLMDKIAMV